MPLRFKLDITKALKSAGYTTYTLQKQGLLSSSTLQKLLKGGQLSWSNIETLCRLLQCQPGDLIEYVPDTPAAHDARE